MSSLVFSPAEIESFRKAGKILRDCLTMLVPHVKEGITTKELDSIAEEFIRLRGGEPGFKGYHGYPATLCTSINEECVHGIPSDRVLNNGDIVSLDCGVKLDGLNTDACITVPVGNVSSEATHLLKVTQDALAAAVDVIRAGVRVGDISATIEEVIRKGKCVPLRPLTGHGLGKDLHEFPDIPNHGKRGSGPILPANTVIAVEPIVSIGSDDVKESPDRWTLSTADGSLSAHFEHTILITEDGCEVLA